jgi:hypothetical protein
MSRAALTGADDAVIVEQCRSEARNCGAFSVPQCVGYRLQAAPRRMFC